MSVFAPTWRTVATAAVLCTASAGLLAAERSLDKQIDVPAGIEAVWQAWTTREGITAS